MNGDNLRFRCTYLQHLFDGIHAWPFCAAGRAMVCMLIGLHASPTILEYPVGIPLKRLQWTVILLALPPQVFSGIYWTTLTPGNMRRESSDRVGIVGPVKVGVGIGQTFCDVAKPTLDCGCASHVFVALMTVSVFHCRFTTSCLGPKSTSGHDN